MLEEGKEGEGNIEQTELIGKSDSLDIGDW